MEDLDRSPTFSDDDIDQASCCLNDDDIDTSSSLDDETVRNLARSSSEQSEFSEDSDEDVAEEKKSASILPGAISNSAKLRQMDLMNLEEQRQRWKLVTETCESILEPSNRYSVADVLCWWQTLRSTLKISANSKDAGQKSLFSNDFLKISLWLLGEIDSVAEYDKHSMVLLSTIKYLNLFLDQANVEHPAWLSAFPEKGIWPVSSETAVLYKDGNRAELAMAIRLMLLNQGLICKLTSYAEDTKKDSEARQHILRLKANCALCQPLLITGTELTATGADPPQNPLAGVKPLSLKKKVKRSMRRLCPARLSTKTRSGIRMAVTGTKNRDAAQMRSEITQLRAMKRLKKRQLRKATEVDSIDAAMDRARRLKVRGQEQAMFDKFMAEDKQVIHQIATSQAQSGDTSLGSHRKKKDERKAARNEKRENKIKSGYVNNI